MWQKLLSLYSRYKSLVQYLLFGALTTLVNYLVYFPLLWWTPLPATVCNVVAWAGAVAFAFVTNKPFVYGSHDWRPVTVFPELGKFVSARAFSGAVETLIVFLLVDLWGLNGTWVKIFTSVFVVVLNYITGKFLVFRRKE